MKFVFPEISSVFDTQNNYVNTIIIENPLFLFRVISEINSQINGNDGVCVISNNNKELPFDKNVELLTQFIPFELNKKPLQSKLNSSLEKLSVQDDYYINTMELISKLENWLYQISQNLNCDLSFDRASVSSIIKAMSPSFKEDYDSLAEKIIDYFELIHEFDREKLFITLNLRDFIDDNDCRYFLDTIIKHQYNLIMIESHEHTHLDNEKRLIIDKDLCEII